MLNDWNWNENLELKDSSGNVVATLEKVADGVTDSVWNCRFRNEECNSLSAVLLHTETKEIAIWQATLWIYDECKRIANSYHHIRDHLPHLHDLRVAAIGEIL